MLLSIIVQYEFLHAEGKGVCNIEYAFPDFNLENKDSAEFQFYIGKITIDREYRDASKIYNVYKFDEIALFLTEGLIIVNSIFTIFVLLLRFRKR